MVIKGESSDGYSNQCSGLKPSRRVQRWTNSNVWETDQQIDDRVGIPDLQCG